MITTKQYYGTPGSFGIIDPALINVRILHVARNGMTHHYTANDDAVDLEFVYNLPSGQVKFDPLNPFAGTDLSTFDKIEVKYKT
jgi:hypothetical protein